MKKTVDARGIACPGPVIETKKALKDFAQGTLEVLVDNAAAVQNLTKLASYLTLPASGEKLDEKNYKVTFEVGEGQVVDVEAGKETKACSPDSLKKGKVVAISADHMGEGDEVLGKLLMKGFIYALTELEQLPGTVLLYNGGAGLSVEGSESLGDLKLLEAQGVEVLTCGTCLNHYGLTEKLSVGAVTNMYVIAEKMIMADSVIKPC